MKFSNYKYLVIEDDTNVWGNIERRMNHFSNWESCGFCDELEASIEKIKIEKPQLIFSDWSIKNGNAYEILNFIEEIPYYKPYVIFFTGYQSEHPDIPQEVINNYSCVKKYLVKPIFENLTNCLNNYVTDAEKQYLDLLKSTPVFIENEFKQKIKICPSDCIAVMQSSENPRIKEIFMINKSKISIKYTWEEIVSFLKNYQVEFVITNHRKSIVNKKHILKIQKPYLWMKNEIKVEVTREQWYHFYE